ncbi:MAG: pantoate--beta-alanine ligase [Elusimicrobia bacterium]|nr:pantoate--beta-alanine ligase [Elusimicrobiota bacterium]
MQILKTIEELKAWRDEAARPVGLVPTMGYLHEGHASLVRQARQECAAGVASIFVNPAQFGPGEDFNRYPRNLEGDLKLLENLGIDAAWVPSTNEIYPDGFQTSIEVRGATARLEGASRPGHFQGVATIVAKLMNLANPDKLYLGQKDAQQVVVLQRMVKDLNFPVEVVVCPTIREPDGLAMSSRNSYLNASERAAAVIVYHALEAARNAYYKGERDADHLKAVMATTIHGEPQAKTDYISIADPLTLGELSEVGADALFSLAVRINKTRLIDNFLLINGRWETGIIAHNEPKEVKQPHVTLH